MTEFEEGVRIDDLGPETLPDLAAIIAVMRDGSTLQMTLEQVLDLFLDYPEFTAKADSTDVANDIAAAKAILRRLFKVRAATTGNVTIATALNPGNTIDGVVLADGDWVLVRAQTTQSQNGVDVVGAAPARAPEFQTYDDHAAAQIIVSEGTTNAGSLWQGISVAGGTLDTTAILFVAPAAASPTKTSPVSADRFWIWDSVAGLMKGLPLGNLSRFARLKITTFTSSGTWTPDANMVSAIIECQGAGGAGGGVASGGSNYWCGGGGGGGAYSRKRVSKAEAGASQTVTVGAGGAGASNGTGGTGSATSVGSLCSASAGGGGAPGNTTTNPGGGVGGLASTSVGDVTLHGNNGVPGCYGNGSPVGVGVGGGCVMGKPGQGTLSTSSGGSGQNGAAGTNGGGGAGANSWNTGTNYSGGAGGNGLVVITEFLSE